MNVVWLVAVNFFESHVCKVWYGKPMEVWPAIPVPNLCYIPVSFIVSRIAYRDCWVNFGREIGTDHVVVCSPVVVT